MRHSDETRSTADQSPPMAWLMAGGTTVLGLIALLTWLAYVNATTVRPLLPGDAKGRPLPMNLDRTPTPKAPASRFDIPVERVA
jgi:hypothetical protein